MRTLFSHGNVVVSLMSAGEQVILATLTICGAAFAYTVGYWLTVLYDELPRERNQARRYSLISAMILLYGVALIFGILSLLVIAKHLIRGLL